MTRERLEGYRSCKEEIQELRYKLDHLGEGDSLIGNDVVMDYRMGYPQPQSVVGYDYGLEQSRRERWEKLIAKLVAECTEVEQWVEAIPDSLTRRVFQLYYIDGMKQNRVAKKVHLSQQAVSYRIEKYLRKTKVW